MSFSITSSVNVNVWALRGVRCFSVKKPKPKGRRVDAGRRWSKCEREWAQSRTGLAHHVGALKCLMRVEMHSTHSGELKDTHGQFAINLSREPLKKRKAGVIFSSLIWRMIHSMYNLCFQVVTLVFTLDWNNHAIKKIKNKKNLRLNCTSIISIYTDSSW